MGLESLFTSGGSDSQSGNRFVDELGGYGRNQANVVLRNQARQPIPYADETGFMPYQHTGLNVFANMLYGRNSGNLSAAGFNLPANNDAVVGSALTQAAPFLFNLQNQNQFLPGQIVGQNTDNLNRALYPMMSGGQFSTSKQRNPGLGYGLATKAYDTFFDALLKGAPSGPSFNLGGNMGSFGA